MTGLCRTEIATRPDAEGNQRTCTAEDAFSASLTFAGGATASIDTAFASAVTRPQEVQVYGSDGLLVLKGADDLTLLRHRQEPQRFDFPRPEAGDVHEPAFIEWATLIRGAVREGRQIVPSFEDGLACAAVMDDLRTGALSVPAPGARDATMAG